MGGTPALGTDAPVRVGHTTVEHNHDAGPGKPTAGLAGAAGGTSVAPAAGKDATLIAGIRNAVIERANAGVSGNTTIDQALARTARHAVGEFVNSPAFRSNLAEIAKGLQTPQLAHSLANGVMQNLSKAELAHLIKQFGGKKEVKDQVDYAVKEFIKSAARRVPEETDRAAAAAGQPKFDAGVRVLAGKLAAADTARHAAEADEKAATAQARADAKQADKRAQHPNTHTLADTFAHKDPPPVSLGAANSDARDYVRTITGNFEKAVDAVVAKFSTGTVDRYVAKAAQALKGEFAKDGQLLAMLPEIAKGAGNAPELEHKLAEKVIDLLNKAGLIEDVAHSFSADKNVGARQAGEAIMVAVRRFIRDVAEQSVPVVEAAKREFKSKYLGGTPGVDVPDPPRASSEPSARESTDHGATKTAAPVQHAPPRPAAPKYQDPLAAVLWDSAILH